MMDLIATLASQTGVSQGLAQRSLGALLCFLRGHLGTDLFEKVEESVPGSTDMITSFEEEAGPPDESAGGHSLLGTVVGLAGKLLGGHAADTAALASEMSRAGLTADQISTFVPRAIELLKLYVPPEVIDKIMAYAPEAGVDADAHEVSPG